MLTHYNAASEFFVAVSVLGRLPFFSVQSANVSYDKKYVSKRNQHDLFYYLYNTRVFAKDIGICRAYTVNCSIFEDNVSYLESKQTRF